MLNQNDLCTWCCKMSSEYIPPSPILTHLQKKLQIFKRHFGKVIVVKYVSKFNLISLIATSHGFFTLCELKMLFSKLFNRVRGHKHKIKLVDSGWMSIIPRWQVSTIVWNHFLVKFEQLQVPFLCRWVPNVFSLLILNYNNRLK